MEPSQPGAIDIRDVTTVETAARLQRGLGAWQARWHTSHYTEFDGNLATATRSGPLVLSPTRLENYARCPFQYFMRHVLKVDEPSLGDDPDDNKADIGTLIHRVLESFMRDLVDDLPRLDRRDAHLIHLYNTFDRHCRQMESLAPSRNRPAWPTVEQVLKQDLTTWYDDELAEAERAGPDPETRWRPHAFEVLFGFPAEASPNWEGAPEPSHPPVSIDLLDSAGQRDGSVAFRGRIDRLDVNAKGQFRVVDYKTGQIASASGQGLALPIYLYAAAQILGLPLEAGLAQYVSVTRTAQFKRISLSGQQLADDETQFKQQLHGLVNALSAGDFHPIPTRANCLPCPFQDVCGPQIEQIMRSKDPALFRGAK